MELINGNQTTQEPQHIRTAKEMGNHIIREFNPLDQNDILKQIFDFVLKNREELMKLKEGELIALKKTFDELLILNR